MEERRYPDYEEEPSMVSEPVAMSHEYSRSKQLTPSQLYLLKVFSHDPSEETASMIRKMVFEYYQQRMDKELDELWDSGMLNQEKLDAYRQMHIRDVLKKTS